MDALVGSVGRPTVRTTSGRNLGIVEVLRRGLSRPDTIEKRQDSPDSPPDFPPGSPGSPPGPPPKKKKDDAKGNGEKKGKGKGQKAVVPPPPGPPPPGPPPPGPPPAVPPPGQAAPAIGSPVVEPAQVQNGLGQPNRTPFSINSPGTIAIVVVVCVTAASLLLLGICVCRRRRVRAEHQVAFEFNNKDDIKVMIPPDEKEGLKGNGV